MNNKTVVAAIGLTFTLFAAIARADTWQVGIFDASSQSPYIGGQRESGVIPWINYAGERFSFDGDKLRYRLNPGQESDIYVAGRLRQRQFYSATHGLDGDIGIEGMKDRDSAFELGLGLKRSGDWGYFSVEGLSDATQTHAGYELAVTYRYPQRIGRWLIEPAIGLQLQSDALVDYYHGVRESEAGVGRPAYRGVRAINRIATVNLGYRVNAKLMAIGGIERISRDSGITDSPIVSRAELRKVFLGLIYTF